MSNYFPFESNANAADENEAKQFLFHFHFHQIKGTLVKSFPTRKFYIQY